MTNHPLLIALLMLAVPGSALGGGSNARKSAPSKGKTGSTARKGDVGGKTGSLGGVEIRDGRVFYDGRDLDKEIKKLAGSLEGMRAKRELVEMIEDPQKRAAKLAMIDKQIKSMEYRLSKYQSIRERAVGDASGRPRNSLDPAGDPSGAASPGKPPPDAATGGRRGASGPSGSSGDAASGDAGASSEGGALPGTYTGGPSPQERLEETQLEHRDMGSALEGARLGTDLFDTSGLEEAASMLGGGGGAGGGMTTGRGRGAPTGGGGTAPAAAPPGRDGGKRMMGSPEVSPRTKEQLILAASTGFKGSFAAVGLKVGPGPDGRRTILRADGSRAGKSDLDALKKHIESQPGALMKRPDFFKVLPREDFESLKSAYAESPAARKTDFKHVGLTSGERDFMWSESCHSLSGSCNPHAKSVSYRKGKYVPPEDLGEISKAVRRKRRGRYRQWDFDVAEAGLAEARSKLSRGKVTPEARAGIWGFFQGVFKSFGGGGGKGAVSAKGGAPARVPSGAAARPDWSGARETVRTTESRPVHARSKGPVPAPGTDGVAGAASSSGWSKLMWGLFLAAALGLVIWGLRRRKDSDARG